MGVIIKCMNLAAKKNFHINLFSEGVISKTSKINTFCVNKADTKVFFQKYQFYYVASQLTGSQA